MLKTRVFLDGMQIAVAAGRYKKSRRCKKDYLTDFFKRFSHAIAINSAFINFVNSRFSNPPRKFEVLS